MPDISFWFHRYGFICISLFLGILVASPPAFSGLFPNERIPCGQFNLKVKTVKDLKDHTIAVALDTKGKTVSIAQASIGTPVPVMSLLAQLCAEVTEKLTQQSSATPNVAGSNGIESFTVGNEPVDVTGGDFNGDGHIDLAVANHASGNISILLNNAGTGFLAPTHVPTGSEPRSIVSSDFNNDGINDLATANLGNGIGDVSLLLGNGGGAFSSPISIAVSSSAFSLVADSFGSSPVSLASADVNKDGNIDLIIADSAGNALVRLGNGNGTFRAPTFLNALGQFSILAEDLNGDGVRDVITNGVVLLNDGTGNFPTATRFATGLQPTLVRAGDLNGDGILDLVTANESSNSVTAYLHRGNGSFQTPLHYIVGHGPGEIIIEDLDDNGTVDLAVSNLQSNHLTILFGTGDGNFIGGQAFPSTVSTNQTTNRAALADFDGDGLLDLAVANIFGNGDAAVLKGQAFGKFAVPVVLTDQHGGEVVTGDFNADSKPDLAFIQQGNPGLENDTIEVRLGKGNLTFGSPTILTLPDADLALNFTMAADMDGNGIVDLVSANTGTGDVSVFLGNRSGTFQNDVTTTSGDHPNWLAVGDLDGNATQDLAVVNAGPLGGQAGKLSILFGTGNGGFSTGPDFFPNTEPNSVVIGDFNGDSKPDFAAIVQTPLLNWNIQIVLGDGNSTFGSPSLIPLAGGEAGNLTAADLDVDGNLDLIMTVGVEIGILEGQGNGTFKPLLLLDGGAPVGPITAIDLNHDQRPDLVVPQSHSGTTAILLNIAAAPTKVSHDINGDGTADIVWRDTSSGAVALWLMNGPSIISSGFPGGISAEWKIAAIGDVNADGKADVIWQNTTSGLVAIWLMNGLTITSVGFPGTAPAGWIMAGTGDLNGNGTADLVWRNTSTGEVALWLMNGTTLASSGFPGGESLTWQIAQVSDVNADGKADVIWHNRTSGEVAIWLMNGLAIATVGFPGTTPAGWVMAGTGDLNGNGTADLIWRNTSTGEVALWLMNGTTLASSGFPGGVSLTWQIAQVGDVNADGKADVMWHNRTSGGVAIWLMNGLAIASVGFPGTAPTEWEIQ